MKNFYAYDIIIPWEIFRQGLVKGVCVMNEFIIIWAVLTVVFVAAEISTVQLISIWLAAGAFITLLCTYFMEIPFWIQLMIFVVTSAVLLAVTFPILHKKSKNQKYIPTNSELDIGKKAVVAEEINADKGTGRVTLNGVDWSAFSENGEIIPKDSIVTVTSVKGAKLKVKL